VSPALSRWVALGIVHWIVKRFCDGRPPATVREIAAALKVPVPVVRSLAAALVKAGILSRVRIEAASAGAPDSSAAENGALQPGRDVALLTVKSVVDAMDHRGCDAISMGSTPALDGLAEALAEMDRTAAASPANRLLKDLDAKKEDESE
jgi:hypothetical protein